MLLHVEENRTIRYERRQKRNVDRDFVSWSAVFRNPVTGSLADRPRALIREPVNPTDRKIGAFLRGGHPHFRRATCEKNHWRRGEIAGLTAVRFTYFY